MEELENCKDLESEKVPESKEYVELNFKLNIGDDSELSAKIDIPGSSQGIVEESKSQSSSDSIYNEDLIFIDPFFILDLSTFKCMSIKNSLHEYKELSIDYARIAMSLMSRSLNKRVLFAHLMDIITGEKVQLKDLSAIFIKIN